MTELVLRPKISTPSLKTSALSSLVKTANPVSETGMRE